MHTRFAPAAALLFVATSLSAAPPEVASPNGLWKITGDVHGRPVEMTCRLNEADHKLSGTCTRTGGSTESHPIDGSVKGDKVEFQLDTVFGTRPITLIVTGKLNPEASHLAGDLEVQPLGVGGKFQGDRQAENAGTTQPPSPTPAQPADSSVSAPAQAGPSAVMTSAQTATGTWTVDADFQGTAAALICTLTQDGTTLGGTCTGEDGKANTIKGTVTDQSLNWHFDAEYQGQPITVTMSGKLTASGTLEGTASVAPLGADGTFTATRKQPAATQPSAAPAPTAGTPPTQ